MKKFKQLREKFLSEASVNEVSRAAMIRKAIDIASSMGGNMTGAVKRIEAIKKGLSKNKNVAKALQLANESVNEGIMKKMSQIQIKRKYGRVIKKALSKGSLELPADAEEALYMYAFDNGEIKTDDPDEFTDWLDNNLKDFA